jgi:hypothetical protein
MATSGVPMLLRAGVAFVWVAVLFVPARAGAQVFTLTRERLIELSAQNPYDRFPDGRPKVPDAQIARARGLSDEDTLTILPGKGFRNQYVDGLRSAPGHQVREGLSLIPMPAYFRHAHPAAISQVMLSGINAPVRIWDAERPGRRRPRGRLLHPRRWWTKCSTRPSRYSRRVDEEEVRRGQVQVGRGLTCRRKTRRRRRSTRST